MFFDVSVICKVLTGTEFTSPNNETIYTGTNAGGETVNISHYIDTSYLGERATLEICYYTTTNLDVVCSKKVYPIEDFEATAGSLERLKQAVDESGLGDLEKVLIATLCTLVMVGLAAAGGGLIGEAGSSALVMILIMMGIFTWLGWINQYAYYTMAFIGVMLLIARGIGGSK